MIYLTLVIFENLETNLNKNEKLALKEIKSWDDKVIHVQDKSSRFAVLSNDDYESKV